MTLLIAPDMDSVRTALSTYWQDIDTPPEALALQDVRDASARTPEDALQQRVTLDRLGRATLTLQTAIEQYVTDQRQREDAIDAIDMLRQDVTFVVEGAKNRTQSLVLAVTLVNAITRQRDAVAGQHDALLRALEDGDARHPLVREFLDTFEAQQVDAAEERIADVQRAIGTPDDTVALTLMDMAQGQRPDDDSLVALMHALWSEAERRGLMGQGNA